MKFSEESKTAYADYEHRSHFSSSYTLPHLLLVQPFLLFRFLLSLTSSFPTIFLQCFPFSNPSPLKY